MKITLGCLFFPMFIGACSLHKVQTKSQEDFRSYSDENIKAFYKAQHKYQNFEFAKNQVEQLQNILLDVQQAKSTQDLAKLEQEHKIKQLSLWQALLSLDNLIDDSDPDTSLPNSIHALQTAEAIRADLPKLASKLNVAVE